MSRIYQSMELLKQHQQRHDAVCNVDLQRLGNGVETYPATAKPTSSSGGGVSPTGTATATTVQSGISPTMTKAPAPVFGMLAGLLAAGVLLRRREYHSSSPHIFARITGYRRHWTSSDH